MAPRPIATPGLRPAPAASASHDDWFVAIAGEQVGPLHLSVVREKMLEGHLGEDSLVWRETMPEWVALRTVGELSKLLADTAAQRRAAPRAPVPAPSQPVPLISRLPGRAQPPPLASGLIAGASPGARSVELPTESTVRDPKAFAATNPAVPAPLDVKPLDAKPLVVQPSVGAPPAPGLPKPPAGPTQLSVGVSRAVEVTPTPSDAPTPLAKPVGLPTPSLAPPVGPSMPPPTQLPPVATEAPSAPGAYAEAAAKEAAAKEAAAKEAAAKEAAAKEAAAKEAAAKEAAAKEAAAKEAAAKEAAAKEAAAKEAAATVVAVPAAARLDVVADPFATKPMAPLPEVTLTKGGDSGAPDGNRVAPSESRDRQSPLPMVLPRQGLPPAALAFIAMAGGFGAVAAFVLIPTPKPEVQKVVEVQEKIVEKIVYVDRATGGTSEAPATSAGATAVASLGGSPAPGGQAGSGAAKPVDAAATAATAATGAPTGASLPTVPLPSEPVATNTLSSADISRVVESQRGGVNRRCWQPALSGNPEGGTAKVSVKLSIGASGAVESVSASGSERAYPGLSSCIAERVRGWKFPASSGSTPVNIPFAFSTR